MSNVIQFQPRSKPAPEAAKAPTAPTAPVGQEVPAEVVEMVKQSAAMTLISTLAFYASQGFDHGKKAQAAMPALKELMATKGILLTLPQ